MYCHSIFSSLLVTQISSGQPQNYHSNDSVMFYLHTGISIVLKKKYRDGRQDGVKLLSIQTASDIKYWYMTTDIIHPRVGDIE